MIHNILTYTIDKTHIMQSLYSACVFTSLMANAAMAYPELDKDGSGKPCSLLASAAQEAAFEKAGEGYKQVPTRAFNKVSGGGGVPE